MKLSKALKLGSAVLILGAGAASAWHYYQSSEQKAMRAAIVWHEVERGDILVNVEASGTVQAERRLVLKPPISGRIESISIKEGDRVKQGQILAYMSSTDRAALIDLARSQGGKEIDRVIDLYRPAPLMAPISGTIITSAVEAGQVVTTQDTTFILVDRPIIVAQVDETDLARISLGQKVDITLDAYQDAPFPGEVIKIAFESKVVNNVTVYEVKIAPATEPEFLRTGMSASVLFKVDERKDVVVAPAAYVRSAGGKHFVFMASSENSKDNPAQKVSVEIGASDGAQLEVLSGLKEGDRIMAEDPSENEKGGGRRDKGDKDSGSNPFAPKFNKGRPRR